MTDGEVEKAALIAGVELVKMGKDNAHIRTAGDNLAYGLEVVTGLVKTALLPLAVVNARASRYFESKFPEELSRRLRDVPPEDITSPKPSVAGPVLQGLGYSHEEESLRELYIALLAKAMDAREAATAHPGFAAIIGALSAEEAQLLKLMLKPGAVPMAELRVELPDGKYAIVLRHLIHATNEEDGVVVNPMFAAYIDNWVRLGLVEVHYDRNLGADSYEWVETRPEYAEQQRQRPSDKLYYLRGGLFPTAYGTGFARAVGIA
jgi:hypothetical protein